METNRDILSSDWQIDEEVKNYLYQTAVLAKYVATLGMFFAVLTTAKTGYSLVRILLKYQQSYLSNSIMALIVGALLAGTVYFAISLFTYRFSIQLQQGIRSVDQPAFSMAWQHFRMAYRSMGIMFILYTGLLLVIFLF